MSSPRLTLAAVWFGLLGCAAVGWTQPALRQIHDSPDANRATIRILAGQRSTNPIPREITGKFAEHLGFNIYNGMDAQILRNPTFAEYPFWNGRMDPDGVAKFQVDTVRITEELRNQAKRFGWPDSELNGLVRSRADALACFWTRLGSAQDVQVSPDTGPYGGRAQRVQIKQAGQGIAQWTWLPLHRQRHFQFELLGRSPDSVALTAAFRSSASGKPLASASVGSLSSRWESFHGTLTMPEDAPADASYELSLTADAPGQVVLGHVFLWPSDSIHGADPDIIRLLKDSHLPLLRWPGGNFASTYHWEDGVGPVERRPTKPNYAWGAIEPNTFGTDEFIAFCRAAGCEPMICVNAGSGTPEEAARWIEYCNGPASSPMGRLRAGNGHPEPYQVKRWEVGNELWGNWQMHWTTASGYVDRFQAFSKAMLAADPTIRLYSCGAPAMWGKHWNDTLIAGLGPALGTITDHPLIGGGVSPSVSPEDVFRDFMAVPEVLQEKWAALRQDLVQGGIPKPRLAVTELQLFAHVGRRTDTNAPVRLTSETMPGQPTITEALYDVLVYHAAIRLLPFVELVTHSAVVNHGGGLRKERERVWANPCYYAQAAFAEFAEATPVPVDIQAATEQAPMVLPDLTNVTRRVNYPAVDALAAIAKDGALLLSIVNRSGSSEPLRLRVEIQDFRTGPIAQVRTLSASTPWDGNSLEHPDLIKPVDSTAALRDHELELDLRPYSVSRLRIPRE